MDGGVDLVILLAYSLGPPLEMDKPNRARIEQHVWEAGDKCENSYNFG